MEDWTANELIDRIKSDQDAREAQEELYARVSESLLERLRRRIPAKLRSRVDPEDILDEAFIRALENLEGFEPSNENSFYAWVYSIAKNRMLDILKRRSAKALAFQKNDDGGGLRASAIEDVRNRQRSSILHKREWIESLLEKLKKNEAEVIRLCKLRGYSFEEVAKAWNKTPGAVQRFYSRSWHKFMELAREQGPVTGITPQAPADENP